MLLILEQEVKMEHLTQIVMPIPTLVFDLQLNIGFTIGYFT